MEIRVPGDSALSQQPSQFLSFCSAAHKGRERKERDCCRVLQNKLLALGMHCRLSFPELSLLEARVNICLLIRCSVNTHVYVRSAGISGAFLNEDEVQHKEKHRPLKTTDEQVRDRMSRVERSQSWGVIVLGEGACAHQGLGLINHRFLKHSQPGLLNFITTDLLGCWRVHCRILAASLYSTH